MGRNVPYGSKRKKKKKGKVTHRWIETIQLGATSCYRFSKTWASERENDCTNQKRTWKKNPHLHTVIHSHLNLTRHSAPFTCLLLLCSVFFCLSVFVLLTTHAVCPDRSSSSSSYPSSLILRPPAYACQAIMISLWESRDTRVISLLCTDLGLRTQNPCIYIQALAKTEGMICKEKNNEFTLPSATAIYSYIFPL